MVIKYTCYVFKSGSFVQTQISMYFFYTHLLVQFLISDRVTFDIVSLNFTIGNSKHLCDTLKGHLDIVRESHSGPQVVIRLKITSAKSVKSDPFYSLIICIVPIGEYIICILNYREIWGCIIVPCPCDHDCHTWLYLHFLFLMSFANMHSISYIKENISTMLVGGFYRSTCIPYKYTPNP